MQPPRCSARLPSAAHAPQAAEVAFQHLDQMSSEGCSSPGKRGKRCSAEPYRFRTAPSCPPCRESEEQVDIGPPWRVNDDKLAYLDNFASWAAVSLRGTSLANLIRPRWQTLIHTQGQPNERSHDAAFPGHAHTQALHISLRCAIRSRRIYVRTANRFQDCRSSWKMCWCTLCSMVLRCTEGRRHEHSIGRDRIKQSCSWDRRRGGRGPGPFISNA